MKPRLSSNPPFSPVLLAGFAMPGIARPVVGRVAQSFATGVWSRHRKNFDRMADFEGTRFLVDPVDLPLLFVLELADGGPQLAMVAQDAEQPEVSATIRGSLRALLDLAEGPRRWRCPLFNRELSIEGDTEAVVALRNAIDDADLNLLEELAMAFGPLSRPALSIAERSAALLKRLSEDADVLQQALLGPLTKRMAAHEAESSDFEVRLAALEKKAKRQASREKTSRAKAAAKKKAEASNEQA